VNNQTSHVGSCFRPQGESHSRASPSLGTKDGGQDMPGRLTARRVATAKRAQASDGGNLYLIVSEAGSRKCVLRFTWRGQGNGIRKRQ
jgi:hypothetical protein